METFSAQLAICAGNSPVPGEFPAQRPVTQSFDVFFDLRLNKRLSKQSWGWWFETLSRPSWRHRNIVYAQQQASFVADLLRGRHYSDVIMDAMASQITSLKIVYSGADQIKHESSPSLAFVRGIHRWPVNSPHKVPVTRKMFLFDDVIMVIQNSMS